MPSQLRLIDLFAGCGGLTAGFMGTGGFKAVAAVEDDLYAAATYAVNFGEAHVHLGDIAEWVGANVPSADVVVGGPPCQGFSNLGARNNRDPRNALWRRYVDTVVRSAPKVFLVENVPEFLRSGQFQALRRETYRSGRLRDYRIDSAVLNAADFGTAQVRRRAFVMGTHRDLPPVGFPIQTHERAIYVDVRTAFDGVPLHVENVHLPASVVEMFGRVVPGSFKDTDIHLTRNFTAKSRARYRHIPPGGNRYNIPPKLQAPCWREHRTGSSDVMGRLVWSKPSVTVRTEFFKPEKGRYLHPSEDRPLTHLEAARLQGFPSEFQWCGTKLAIARQIGNAVPVPLSSAVARHILEHLSR